MTPAHHPRHVPIALVPSAAAACAFIGGCGYQAPTVEVKSAAIVERTDQHTVVNLTIEATNPNTLALPLRRIDYTVGSGGATFSGVRSPEATLPPGGTRTITFPAVLPAAAVGSDGGVYTVSGTILYTTPGQIAELLFDTGVSRPTVGFRGDGPIAAK